MGMVLSKCGIPDVFFFVEREHENHKRYVYKTGYIKLSESHFDSNSIEVSDSEAEQLENLTRNMICPCMKKWMVRNKNMFYRIADVTDCGKFVVQTDDLGTVNITEEGMISRI